MFKKLLKLFLLLTVIFTVTIPVIHADIIIIDPDPPGGEEPPPVPDPEPEPEEFPVMVDIKPEKLNINSNRRFITAYIELPEGYEPGQVDIATVKITKINEEAVDPIFVCSEPTEIGDYDLDGIPDLMVKFLMDDVREVIFHDLDLTFTLEGNLMASETSFYGNESVRAVDVQAWVASKNNKNFTLTTQRQFRYKLGKHISPDSDIIKAVVWTGYDIGSVKNIRHLWMKGKLGKWVNLLCKKFSNYYFLPLTDSQKSYEWDVTDIVKNDWENGLTDIILTIDFDSETIAGYPRLIVTYNGTPLTEDTVLLEQMLVPIAPRVSIPEDETYLKLHYSDSKLNGIEEDELGIYGWDKDAQAWVLVTDAVIDTDDNSITTNDIRFTQYQIMFYNPPAVTEPETPQKNACASLGQNFPNPFNPATTIEYFIPKDCHVTMKLYNVRGKLVAIIVDEFQFAGNHSVYFDAGERLARGIYYYQMTAGSYVGTKRMTVLR